MICKFARFAGRFGVAAVCIGSLAAIAPPSLAQAQTQERAPKLPMPATRGAGCPDVASGATDAGAALASSAGAEEGRGGGAAVGRKPVVNANPAVPAPRPGEGAIGHDTEENC